MFRKISQSIAMVIDNAVLSITKGGVIYRMTAPYEGNGVKFDMSQGQRFSELFYKASDIDKVTKVTTYEEIHLMQMDTPLEQILSEESMISIEPLAHYRSKINAAIIFFIPIPDGSGRMERVVLKRPHKGLSDHYQLRISKRFFDVLQVDFDQVALKGTGFSMEDMVDLKLHQDSCKPGAILRVGKGIREDLLKVSEAFSDTSDDKETEQQQTPGEVSPEMEIRVN